MGYSEPMTRIYRNAPVVGHPYRQWWTVGAKRYHDGRQTGCVFAAPLNATDEELQLAEDRAVMTVNLGLIFNPKGYGR